MENFTDGMMILGVPAVILVPLIVEGLKKMGLPTKYAIFAALLAGLVIAILAESLTIWPVVTPIVRVLVATVLLGFGAAGVYSQAEYRNKA